MTAAAVALEAGYTGCAVGVAVGVVVTTTMVVTCFYRLRRENVVEILSVVVVRPVFDYLEHIVVDFTVGIPESRVVEHADDVVQDLVDGNVWVVPCIDDAGRDVLQDCYGYLTGRWVENVGEMVLG